MLNIYQCYIPKPTNTYDAEERCPSDLGWLASSQAQINSAVLQKTSGVHKKQPVDISSMLSEFLYNNQNSRPIDFL